MAIKFLLDKALKEQQETIAKILEVVGKKPYPTVETDILASFTHALFKVGPKFHKIVKVWEKEEGKEEVDEKIDEDKSLEDLKDDLRHKERELKGVEREEKKELKIIEKIKKEKLPEVEKPKSKDMPKPPMPPPNVKEIFSTVEHVPKPVKEVVPETSSNFKKKEYVVNAFGRPVGVLVDKDDRGEVKLSTFEPILEDSILLFVKDEMRKEVKKNREAINDDKLLEKYLMNATKKLGKSYIADMITAAKYYLKRDFFGFNRIEILMDDPKVRGIYCEGVNKPLSVKYNGLPGKLNTNIVFPDLNELNLLLMKLAKATGNDLTDEKPILNVMFQGFKIQITKGIGGVSSRFIVEKVGV